jgi:tryptophan 2,3-dioxygenase
VTTSRSEHSTDGAAAGCPVGGGASVTESTPYAAYAQMDALLDLQHPQTTAGTEPGFIIMSQVMELLFKLLHVEFEAARNQVECDRVGEASRTLRRALSVQQTALSSWDFFGAISPTEFAEFRDVLGSASGFQSASYRRVEFLLGNKTPALVRPHRGTRSHDGVLRQLCEPSLYDAVLALLRRRGLAIADDVLDAGPGAPYRSHVSVEDAWRVVYQNQADHHDLYLLAETLIDVAEAFARWRYTHLVVVQRVLGGKPGTGGTDGVPWLGRIAEHRFFPELWSVRSLL